MSVSLLGRCPEHDDRALAARSGAARIVATIRAMATPSNVTLAGVVTVGWLALIAWTGTGPDNWQARSCADFDLGRPACNTVRASKDQSRLAPHSHAVEFAR